MVKAIGLFGIAIMLMTATAAHAQVSSVRTEDVNGVVSIQAEGKPVLEYAYDGVPFKPCVRTWRTPSGVNILRDSPSDHLHHHALMFAVKADDVNFWEETPGCGYERHLSFGEIKSNVDDKGAWARITENLSWIAADQKTVILQEHRVIETPFVNGVNASLITWQTTLSAPEGKEKVTLTGAHYHGLGLRFVESMDKDGQFLNASKAEGEVVRGEERLTRTPWCAYTAKADGKPVTVAVFDHPANPRPALWFTMPTPFAYLCATMNYWKEPFEITAGKPAVLRYGIALWDGSIDAAQIETVYQQWLAIAPK